jgi:hypothetical protein
MAIRAGDHWMSKGGNPDDPENVLLGDTNLKRAAANPEGFGIHQNDLVVSIWEGTMGDAEDYFSNTRIHTLRNTNNIVLLDYGANNLYSELLGGKKVAASPSMKFLQDYGEQIDLLHNNFPHAQILSSDPVPRHTSGFCNSAIVLDQGSVHGFQPTTILILPKDTIFREEESCIRTCTTRRRKTSLMRRPRS